MRKNILIILIIFVFAACGKQTVVDTKKEAESVRAIVSKIPGKKVSTARITKDAVVIASKGEGVKKKELDLSLIKQSKFVYSYKNRRDPFYSLMVEKMKMKAEEKEKKRKEEEERKKAKLGTNMSKEEWGKVRIAAILGNSKGFLVLFGGEDTIYQKNDYIDKDNKIQIVGVNKNSVDLMMNKNGRILEKRIKMQLEEITH